MGLIVNAIQALGVQVKFIPACCTGLVQLVNVGYNKSFKCKMRDEFLAWMILQDPNDPVPGSTCHDVAQWIINTVICCLVMYHTKVLMYRTRVLLACLTKVRC
jgi:hypothetical protein